MKEYNKVAVLENEVEALLLESVLNQRDIPHAITSYYDTAYDGLFQTQKGWGSVSAPSEYEAEIKEIISSLRENNS